MRKLYICLVLLICAGFCFAATWRNGVGGELTATAAAQKCTLTNTVNTLSINNSGANKIYVLVNCATQELNTAITAGNAIPIPAGSTFTFDAQGNASIESFCHKAASGTSAFIYGAY
jgi:hypothetical protein